jgi:hypothetical protein
VGFFAIFQEKRKKILSIKGSLLLKRFAGIIMREAQQTARHTAGGHRTYAAPHLFIHTA